MTMRASLKPLRYSVLLLLGAAAGCHAVGEPSSRRVIGVIENGNTGIQPPLLPDTVAAGTSFAVTVTTFGGACDRADGTDVTTTGSMADITPYVLLPPRETNCIALLVTSPRSVTLTFATPGTGIVRVHGRRFDGTVVTLQGSVVVRP